MMNNLELARELRRWARARDNCNRRRKTDEKPPLESDLLILAADRLELSTEEGAPSNRMVFKASVGNAGSCNMNGHDEHDHRFVYEIRTAGFTLRLCKDHLDQFMREVEDYA